ncbi:hypothetical protein TcCL_ESM08218 [Trypanosoma cruzi]|nr:hypothetical protein TcCL_ESM08218 [Trypanosoma cruzi]
MACYFELHLFAAPRSEVLCAPTSMVGGKMAERADKAKRTTRASACMIRKGFLSHFPPAISTSPESGIKTAPHPWSDAPVMMAADAFSVGLMIRLRLYSRSYVVISRPNQPLPAEGSPGMSPAQSLG